MVIDSGWRGRAQKQSVRANILFYSVILSNVPFWAIYPVLYMQDPMYWYWKTIKSFLWKTGSLKHAVFADSIQLEMDRINKS